MAEGFQKKVELGFDAVRRLRSDDDRLHHCVRVLAKLRIGDQLEQRPHAEHVAPQALGVRGLDFRGLLTVAVHAPKPHGVE
jgi:hypothetical protein